MRRKHGVCSDLQLVIRYSTCQERDDLLQRLEDEQAEMQLGFANFAECTLRLATAVTSG